MVREIPNKNDILGMELLYLECLSDQRHHQGHLYPQHQQYAPTPNQPAFSYNQGPPQQSYSAPPVNTPYGNIPYQAHQTYQYSGPVPTQYGGPPHMNLGPSNNEQYAMSQNTIPFETQSLHPHGNQTGGYGAQGPVAKRERQFNAGIPRNTPSTTISQSNGPNAASSKRGSDADHKKRNRLVKDRGEY
ncbi:hypothetical protein M7I_2421 [Glarea lozoyensis 74030]|uniref:Uncharacterized protein n=1 Tax=Glarea lozoyensis (strain ATCC 74030 / MF5533) TaxID=1104152 RepID=H0EIQ7_GLAL7|nr:hypothetical protein M7I_2421 [Glarea lozoyensis 74030]